MPNLLTRLARAAGYVPDVKAAPLGGPGVMLYGDARPVWTARDGTALAREGYQRNAVVHRAVRLVAEGAAAIPLIATGPGDHPILALLARPNPREGGTRLLETVYGHLMVSGNADLWGKCTMLRRLRHRLFRRPVPAGCRGNWRLSMSFVQRELDRIRAVLLDPNQAERRDEFYAAQQALSWALDPEGAKSPFQMLTGTPASSEDCSERSYPPSS